MAFWCILSGIFCWCPRQKNVKFSAWSGDLVDVEDVLLNNSEYSVRVMGLISFLLHYCIECKQSGVWNFEMTKSGGTISISVPLTPNSVGLVLPWFTPMVESSLLYTNTFMCCLIIVTLGSIWNSLLRNQFNINIILLLNHQCSSHTISSTSHSIDLFILMLTRSSATADGLSDAWSELKSHQLIRNYTKTFEKACNRWMILKVKVIWNGAIQHATNHFLSIICSNHVSVLHHFQDITTFIVSSTACDLKKFFHFQNSHYNYRLNTLSSSCVNISQLV